ncbi:FAD linked oxidase domain-containing protein [Alicyclobacillus hesperidum URH17-3-68]|uniref:FAD-binding oxidoreductase n=1 Tax=Alicyclobacillus hesperidum TaxID=89784 RepID=UPI000281C1FF|nr:FAD-linked oxidase C-terminal domain-containing protein [Alicyclobacillus hesperidum]EJY54427.1 FAD linked oxidase domain-containing protein [Alicyclobacillus hesperidum URH17-3-68]
MTADWKALQAVLGVDKVSWGESIRRSHARDESYHPEHLPDVVVFAESLADICQTVEFAKQNQVPIVPFGAGSGLEGHVIPVHGGISLDVTRMNRILEIRPNDFLVCVEPGVTRQALNDALRPYGLFFPVDPGANATIGGMAATNASGTTAVRYGAMKDNVRSIEVVLADGRVIQTGSLAAKSSSGYHLTELFVGSEGTLGIFSKLWLRLYGIPERTVAAAAEFSTVQKAVQAVCTLLGAGLLLTRCELVSRQYMEVINKQLGTQYAETPTLFLELSGSEASVQADTELVEAILRDEGCAQFRAVQSEEDRRQLWTARHNAAYALMRSYPGLFHMSTDVCVPISQLPEAIAIAETWMERLQIRGGIIGHVGDGNFHVGVMVDTDDSEDLRRAEEFSHHVVEFALSVGGTCTGEHGVGLGKRAYQEAEHGPALAIMQNIKRMLDPLGIFNPGKLVD